MVSTRDEQVNILKHLLFNVLSFDENDTEHPVVKSLTENDIKTVSDFEGLEETEINQLMYTKTDAATNTSTSELIPVGHKANLRWLRKYIKLITAQYDESHNIYPPLAHWQTLNCDLFMVFKAKPPAAPIPTTRATTTSTAITSTDFKKSIKRDVALYPELKDILHFNTWKVQFEALIAKDQLGHVIDAGYTPLAGTDEAITFRLQQDFVFSVFASKLKAAEAKQLVLQHVHDNNAQLVYKKLKQEATQSARAKVERDKHSAFLSTKTLDSRWKGTQDGFIIYWMAELERYEQLSDIALHYPPEQKKDKLQAALRPQPNLRNVESMHQMMNLRGNHRVNYD